MVKMKAVNGFASTVWGNVGAGETFDVEDGYVRDLETQGVAHRVDAAPAPAPVAVKLPEGSKVERDGDTVNVTVPGGEGEADDPTEQFTRALTGQNRSGRRGRR